MLIIVIIIIIIIIIIISWFLDNTRVDPGIFLGGVHH